jgi:hypothetical protein
VALEIKQTNMMSTVVGTWNDVVMVEVVVCELRLCVMKQGHIGPRFGGKKSAIEIDQSIWREEIGNRNRLDNLAGRNSKRYETLFG